jgi:tRNA threonylcarbamoyladenosine biosynthesis protein TsaB
VNVVAIETSTPQTSIAVGSETEVLAAVEVAGRARQDLVVPALERLLLWIELPLSHVGGVAVGLGPGLFTGLRVGIEAGKALAQVLHVPIVGIPSLDILAFGVRYTRRLIAAVIDARRGEVFYAFYRSVPGGVMREGDYRVAPPDHLAAEVEAAGEDVLLVGNGAIQYRRRFEEAEPGVEFASPALAHPRASSLVEVSVPRFLREETDRLFDVVPMYLRKSDAELNWEAKRQ